MWPTRSPDLTPHSLLSLPVETYGGHSLLEEHQHVRAGFFGCNVTDFNSKTYTETFQRLTEVFGVTGVTDAFIMTKGFTMTYLQHLSTLRRCYIALCYIQLLCELLK